MVVLTVLAALEAVWREIRDTTEASSETFRETVEGDDIGREDVRGGKVGCSPMITWYASRDVRIVGPRPALTLAEAPEPTSLLGIGLPL
jgi:hypothetical protein